MIGDVEAALRQIDARFQLRAVFNAPTRQPGNKASQDASLAQEEELFAREILSFLLCVNKNVKEIFERFVEELRNGEKAVVSDSLLQ